MTRAEELRRAREARFAKNASKVALKEPGRPMKTEGAICPVHSYLTVGEYEAAVRVVTEGNVTMSSWIRMLLRKELGL